MSYDLKLGRRVARMLGTDFEQKKLFGGLGFFLNGNMCVGVWKEWLILRVGPEVGPELLQRPSVKPFDITGKVMKGWVMVEQESLSGEEALKEYLFFAVEFVDDLPPKK